MRWLPALALASLCLAQKEPCTVEGQVFNAASGEPLKRVQILLRPAASGGGFGAVSDTAGRFHILNVPPGRYIMSAERGGFVRGEYGGRGRRGAIFTLNPGQHLKDVVFRMLPQAVITGRVLDEEGEPVAWANITLMRRGYDQGRRTLVPAGGASTNDLGEYRIAGLNAGRYYIAARQRSLPIDAGSAEDDYVTTYYPNTMDPAAAAPLELTAAAQLRGIDVVLRRARTARLSGRISDSSSGGASRRNVMIFLMPRDGTMRSFNSRNAVMARDGRFEIRSVLPGAYILAGHLFENGERYYGTLPVDVGNADIEDLNIVLSPGVEVRGRVRVEDGGDLAFGGMRVALRPVNEVGLAASMGGAVAADGSFDLRGLAPEPYLVQVFNAPENCYLKSVRFGDTPSPDLTLTPAGSAPLDIVLSRNGAQVEGVVTEEAQPAPGVTVVLVPDAAPRVRRELYRVTNTDQQGRFSIKGIPPGDYHLFAWADVPQEAWLDPEFLKPFESAAESLSVKENAREQARLKLLPAADSVF